MSFQRVSDLLADVLAHPATDPTARGAPAVRSYLQTLQAQFPRRAPMQIDARLRFYLENKRIIDEWAGLVGEARVAADAFFRTLVDPLHELAARLGEDVAVHAQLDDTPHPKLMLYRQSWLGSGGGFRVGVGLEWARGSAAFDKSYSGVWVNRSSMETSKPLHERVCRRIDARKLPKESRSSWWPMWSYEPTPPGTWWDDLPALREHLVGRVEARWEALAECVDLALAGD